MPTYCPPLSAAPNKWRRGTKDRWTCLSCNRTGLIVRHRHRAWPKPVKIPVWGDRNGSYKEIVGYALVSPMDAHLKRYKWRITVKGYVYRQTWAEMKDGTYKRHNLYIHRAILGLEAGNKIEGHHRDDEPTNNQRWNLQRVTRSENEQLKHGRNVRNGSLRT